MAQQVPELFDRIDRIIRRPELQRLLGLSRSALYRRISEGTFPRPIPLCGGRAVGWRQSEISEFLAKCVAQRDQRAV